MKRSSQKDGASVRRKEMVRKGRQFFSHELSAPMNNRRKRTLSSGIVKLAGRFSYFLSHISTKVYGAALLTFGITSLLLYILGISCDTRLFTPIISIVFSAFAVPFLLADEPLPIFLQSFKITDYIFFEFFCMKRHTILETQKKFPIIVAVLIGLIPGVLSSFVDLWRIAIAIALLVCGYISLESPEFLFFSSLFALPYFRLVPYARIWLIITVLFACFSFFRKIIYGKRVIYIEQYEIALILMMLFILVSGIFIKGIESFSGSLEMIVLAMGYILSGNIITNRRLADRTANSIISSGAITSVISIAQLIYLLIKNNYAPTKEQMSLILVRGEGVSVFVLVSLVFAIGMAHNTHNRVRGIYSTVSALLFISLIITGEPLALVALIAGVIGYVANRKNMGILLPVILALPIAFLFLPSGLIDGALRYSPSLTSAAELFRLWRSGLSAVANNLLVGIGIGDESFIEEMAGYGIFGLKDSSNLFIEICLEAGVFALIAFISIILIRLRHRAIHSIYLKNSQIESISNVSAVSIFCLISFGMVNYIWSDPFFYYLFWCVFGIGSATLRVAKKDYDDRVLYYEELGEMDSSVVDIIVR